MNVKDVKTMTYKELERELSENRAKLPTASLEAKRQLINRDHDLMTEMDRRWDVAEKKRDGR